MAHIFLSQLKTALNNCLDELEQIHFLFSRNPETDFTRKRKLTFKEYIQFMLLMQGKAVSNEILDSSVIPYLHHQNQHLHSNVTSFFLKDGISCSTHLSISVVPYRIISIMVTDFWPAMALMLTFHVTRQMKEPSSMKAKRLQCNSYQCTV